MSEPQTKAIRDLVSHVLEHEKVAMTEHVIDDVFHAIEQSVPLRAEYEGLCGQFGLDLTHQMIARWVKSQLGWATGAEVAARRNTLTKNYSTLIPSSRKLTSQERRAQAAEAVFEFFRRFKFALDREQLSPWRDELQSRVVRGDPVEDAFLAVMTENGMDTAALRASIGSGPTA